jgi:hypothetical protein
MICKIKRVLDGSEQGLDVVVTLVLFQERLSSIRIWHERLVWIMTEMHVPLGLLKVNRGPSSRLGRANWGS